MRRRPVRGLLLALAVLAAVAGCEPEAEPGAEDAPGGDGPGAEASGADASGVDVSGGRGVDLSGASPVAHDDGRPATGAGWERRRVGGQPALVAGEAAEPLTVALTGLEPGQPHDVLVAYPLEPGEDADAWGLRAGIVGHAGAAGDHAGAAVTRAGVAGDLAGAADEEADALARLDGADRRLQPDPANPRVVEAALGRARPDADGRLEVAVAPLEGADSGLVSVRALPAPALDAVPTAEERRLGGDVPPAVPATDRDDFPGPADYMRMLERWPAYAEDGVTEGHAGEAGLAYYGDGSATEQGMRTLGSFIYAYALLAVDERYDPDVSGVPQPRLEARARAALAYMTRTHETGDLPATDGEAWGDHWQSSWWTSRMAGGARLLWDRLDAGERQRVRRVVAAEADRQVERDPPSGADDDSKAEENAWDSEVLAWAVALLPDDPRAPEWRAALDRWAMNALSAPDDARDDRVVAGRPVRAWNETTNVGDDFTVQNHGAYHAGYMVWPLHSLAWGTYALAGSGEPVPETLAHHTDEVWQRLTAGYLGGGRLAYAGGKDWPQHAYALYLLVPVAALRQHVDDDPLARAIEADRVRLLEWEQRLWGDGGFFSGRFTGDSHIGWDAEFESDAAASLAFAYHLTELLGDEDRPERLSDERVEQRLAGSFYSSEADFGLARAGGFATTFGWRTLDCCFGSISEHRDVLGVVVGDDPHLAAWTEGQLAGELVPAGSGEPPRGVRWRNGAALPGGTLATLGVRWIGGSAADPVVDQQLAMVSLPGMRRALVLDKPVAREPVELTSSTALDLEVTNDVFNGLSRRVVSGERELTVAAGRADREIALPADWADVDGSLGVAVDGTAGSLELRTRAERNLPWNSLRSETLRWRPRSDDGVHAEGEVVRRLALGFGPGGPEAARRLSEQTGLLATGSPELAAAWIAGERDGEDVTAVVAANFADGPREVTLDVAGVPGVERGELSLEVPARSVVVRQR